MNAVAPRAGATPRTTISATRLDAPMMLVGRHRLVGRDQDEALDAVPERRRRRPSRVPSTLLVIASTGFCFHQRHVLVGGGMEDDLGPVRREDRLDPPLGRGRRR